MWVEPMKNVPKIVFCSQLLFGVVYMIGQLKAEETRHEKFYSCNKQLGGTCKNPTRLQTLNVYAERSVQTGNGDLQRLNFQSKLRLLRHAHSTTFTLKVNGLFLQFHYHLVSSCRQVGVFQK